MQNHRNFIYDWKHPVYFFYESAIQDLSSKKLKNKLDSLRQSGYLLFALLEGIGCKILEEEMSFTTS